MGSRCRLLFKQLSTSEIGKRALQAPFFLVRLPLLKGLSVGRDGHSFRLCTIRRTAENFNVDLVLVGSKRCALKGSLKLCAKVAAIDDSLGRFDPNAEGSSLRV